MKSIRIHHPHASTHLPTHELAARRRRQKASLPAATKPTRRPTPPALTGRKTVPTYDPAL